MVYPDKSVFISLFYPDKNVFLKMTGAPRKSISSSRKKGKLSPLR